VKENQGKIEAREEKEQNAERREGKHHVHNHLNMRENWTRKKAKIGRERFLRRTEKPECIKCENNGQYQNGWKQMWTPLDKSLL